MAVKFKIVLQWIIPVVHLASTPVKRLNGYSHDDESWHLFLSVRKAREVDFVSTSQSSMIVHLLYSVHEGWEGCFLSGLYLIIKYKCYYKYGI